MVKVLVACEFSATVREAFRRRGYDATSCDLLPCPVEGPHYRCDVRAILDKGWDLMIAHPPCTYLCQSGLGWMKTQPGRKVLQDDALEFVKVLLEAPIPHIALENPVGVISSRIRPADQTIHPWQFGHGERKATCLWLKTLPRLKPTEIVKGREQKNRWMPPSPDRWMKRSITYKGIAEAMAEQWGPFVERYQRRKAAH